MRPLTFSKMDFSQSNLFGYIEDLQELTIIERPVRRSLKTPEEIERLTVDEELSDIERAVYLLSSGQDIQGTSVVANLPVLMRQNPAETLRRVLPKIREVLHVAGVEMQLTAAVSFLTVLQEESVSIHTYSHSFLHIILQNLEHRDAGVSNAWLETLLAVIEALPKETVRHEILNPLVSKAQLAQTLQSRLVSCKIMGKVANKFEAHIIKREVLPLVKSLCQDVEYEVRTCICRQLEHIARGIGTELTKTVVLPELVELARDEGSSVRLAAFETLVNLLDMFDADDRSQTVLPLVKSFCEKSFKADESILVSLSFHLGKLCNGLYGIFTPEQHLRFLEFYKKLSTLGLQQENGHSDNQLQLQTLEQEKKYISVRKNCAYNFPAMIVFVDPKNFHLELYSIFFCLCHDPEVPVRYTMAISFFEVAKLLNSDVYTIHKELVTLLQDESLEVLDALVGHLPEILELMANRGENNGSESKLLSIPDLIPALTTAEQRAATSLKWRTHEKLLQKYACLPHIISSDQIYYRFLHRMLTIILTNNVLPVQKAAARTLCIYLRYNRKQEQRHEVIQKLIEQLGQGKSYWNRLRFLDTCEFIMELFSKSFFCKYFFLPVLELTHDPVANVRMKLCYLLPKVKSTLKIPTDKHLLQQLELCIRKLLCQEKDKDVLTIVKRTVLELDRMEISVDAFQKRFYEYDLLDQEKERQEHLLLEMEQLEKEKQQTEGRSTNINDKMFEKKRRDSKASSVLAKSINLSVPGSSSGTSLGKEEKKSKLVRSQSFSTQALHPKYSNIDKCPNKSSATGYTSSVSGMGKSCMLSFSAKILYLSCSSLFQMIHSGLILLAVVGMLPSFLVLLLATYLTQLTKRTMEIRRVSPEG
ncbi:serine/threonine-protein phosphatase 4 regulatory subunit 4 isoform X2 [Chiroxiphia lanceolata]|uniref:serine/threonine-protein phosphatase 4 regulatory subunit 4 isoform X2 n=1 Tax=Chiroxiphia lanceolata TaxID=296741 RepID=UPI0013CEC397|nr:serine/threonine-protein phosphatase 4 regulatory subunit 4 isoform X2 [Chiroxiphia lanceolata]XP_032546903.1 serine/threonine-protein phosphatase 4 regulatory subunit 4 isoform X2 [Chiroxiphia lanceolata]